MKQSLLKFSVLCLSLFAAMTVHAVDVVALWDFQTMAADAVSFEKTSGTVPSDVAGIELTVDATNGKLATRGSDAQFNAGTIIKVPVKSVKDTVTVTSYPNYHAYTVGGIATTADVTNHTATTAEATQGYVEIIGTGSSYLYAIRVVHVSMIQEKMLYTSTFTEWTNAPAATTESAVIWATKYSHESLVFSLYNTLISSTNQNVAKFPSWTGGYLMCSKAADPYVITSKLANITRVHFLHGATGSNRGWRLEAKGDGDADWVVLSNTVATTASGTNVDVDVNRTNCQLRFTNLNVSNNAYLFQLDIYGNVDLSKMPALGTISINGTTYQAADVFKEMTDGSQTATIEISKKQSMISETNPITATALNGQIGTLVYETVGGATTVTIPVTANGETVNYKASVVFKPDFTLTYYNTDGTTVVGTQTVEKEATISAFPYSVADLTIASGYAFRGWAAKPSGSNNRKFVPTDVITANTAIYALATEIETMSTTRRYEFNMADQYFYDEDHEAFNLVGSGKFHDGTHGWQFADGDSLKLLVGGNAYILASLCRYGSAATIKIIDSKGNQLSTIETPVTNDGSTRSYYYQGPADNLTLVFSGSPYVHSLTILNVQDSPISAGQSGYYVVKAGDAANLLSTIEVANANASDNRTFIFVPKGTYNLGEKVLTPISGNNISIIGEDRDATIIVNAPKVENEGIGTTATFLISGQNTYFQDLTLRNALDYYASGSAGRAVVIQDKANRTICKNVKMLSYQDTYYSNSNGQFYFEDGEIHGTVDYLCGDGDVFFNRVKLVNESRTADGKTGGDVIAAPYPSDNCKFGYVFDGCTIDNLAASFSLGRSWGGLSKLTYLNTIILQPAEIDPTRFTTGGMNVYAYSFKEYGSVDGTGTVVTPASNVQTFTKDMTSSTYNTTMSVDSVALFAITKVFPDWTPDVLSQQVKLGTITLIGSTLNWESLSGTPAYAVFADGVFKDITNTNSYAIDPNVKIYSIRAANTMGGFGQAQVLDVATSINKAKVDQVVRTKYYSVDGTRLPVPRPGVNVRVNELENGKTTAEKVVIR